MSKDANSATGAPRSHYSPSEYGPFACHECAHFRWPNQCDHPDVIADSKAGAKEFKGKGLSKSGLAIVEPGGCCEYERKK